ncbi:MAG: hypothetical protein PHD99_04140 [Candidatus Moranbacteria bacterium]|nr:hypothetical protein [Candidatus Moranbacteria bacterium]
MSERPMSVVPLTNALNERFDKGYAPSLIGSDMKTLITFGLVKVDSEKCFSLTTLGLAQSKIDAEKAQPNDQSKQALESV